MVDRADALDSAGRLDEEPAANITTLRMKLIGGNDNAEVAGVEQQSGKVSYFIGNDPKEWQTDVPTYGRVQCKEIYRGMDLAYHGEARQLE